MPEWLGNAAVHESNRKHAADLAARAREAGDEDAAATFDGYAAQHEANRDRVQRTEERAIANRRAHLPRWW